MATEYDKLFTDPNNREALSKLPDILEYDSYFEDEFNAGNPNLIYYRLFRFNPDDPDTLYSPVGTTWGNEEHFITNEFSRTGVNVDTSGQGFFATSNPEAAAWWFREKKDKEGGYYYSKNRTDSYAVFPVIGTPHNAKYFREHPEVFNDFGIADGYIIDEMQIIGDPIYVWHNKDREKVLQENREFSDYSSLSNILEAIKDNRVDSYVQLYRREGGNPEFLKQAERAIDGTVWGKMYRQRNRQIAEDFGWDEDDRILAPSERNKQKARQVINLLKTI